MKSLILFSLTLPLGAQNLIINGSFEDPVSPNPSINSSPTVPGWSGIPFLFSGDNGDPWPDGAAQGNQFADAGNGSSVVIAQTFSAPDGLASIQWRATTSAVIGFGSYRVQLKSSPSETLLLNQVFTVFGGASFKDTWDLHTLNFPATPYPPGDYTLTYNAVITSGQDFFIDEVLALAPVAPQIEPGNTTPGSANAWAANAGWLNFLPTEDHGALVTESYLARFIYAANFGWINLGDGSPENGHTYSNTTGEDSGVNLLPNGALSGLAWSANIGWIKLDSATGSNRARLDLLTGQFHGYAYAANAGWINLGDGNLIAANIHCPDLDNDGLADSWERQHFGSLSANTDDDPDGDGFTNSHEYTVLTNPNSFIDFPASSTLRLASSPSPVIPDFWSLSLSSNPGRIYQLERSTDLKNWTPHGAPQSPTAPRDLSFIGALVTDPNNEFFFRIAISKPLP